MLTKMASRRMLFAGLQRGWEAWAELCESKRGARQLIKQVGSRVQIKGVGAAFTVWARVVRQERLAMLGMGGEEKLARAQREIKSLDHP